MTINDDFITFGCRKSKDEATIVGDAIDSMLGHGSFSADKVTKDAICLSKFKIDRTTGVWTTVNSGALTGGSSMMADCKPLPKRRQF